ncbi:MAG: Dabb family protein [Pyrinomonadaceae bacterium]
MFVHVVYFWLRDDLKNQEKKQFVDGVNSLTSIETITQSHVGVPADTDREIIDSSYSYALVLMFADRQAHDLYQTHPTHDKFRDSCASLWRKVLIYDSVSSIDN